MTGDQLDAILKASGAKSDKEGWCALPEGGTMTLHVAHDGASMTIPRVDSVRQDGDLLFARNPKREMFALVKSDVYAIAFESDATAGKVVRRAGFG